MTTVNKVLDFDFTKSDASRSLAMPAAAGKRYYRNQDLALQLVPQYAPVIDGARLVVNYSGYSDPTLAQMSTGSNVTQATTPIKGFRNSIQFGDNSVLRVGYSASDASNQKEGQMYTVSCFIEMDDGSEPQIGRNSNEGDFSIVVGGTIATSIGKENVYDNVWRCWTMRAEDSTPNPANGVIKYTSQSTKGFRVTGFMTEDTSHKGPEYLPSEYVYSGAGTSYPGYRYFFDRRRANFAWGNNNLEEVATASDSLWNAAGQYGDLTGPPTLVTGFPDVDGSGAKWYYIQENTDNAQHVLRWTATYSEWPILAIGLRDFTDICISGYVTQGERTDCMIQTIATGNHQRAWIDLTDGSTYDVSPTFTTFRVTDTGKVNPINGGKIWKYEAVYQDSDRAFTPYMDIAIHDGVGVSGIYTGDGASGIYFSAIQWEYGSERSPTMLSTHVNSGVEVSGAPLVNEVRGLVSHNARTNLVAECWDFNTTWAESGAETVLGVQTTTTFDPMGGRQATIINDDGLGGTASIGVQYGVTLATSTDYLYGFFAKKYSRNWVYGSLSALGALDVTQYFDLANGVIGTSGANINHAGMIPFRDEWYFCWFTFTSDAVDTTATLNIFAADADLDTVVTRNGVASVSIFGPQLYAGKVPLVWTYTDGATATTNALYYNRPASDSEVDMVANGFSAYHEGERFGEDDHIARMWGFGNTSDEAYLSYRDDVPDALTAQTRLANSISGSVQITALSGSVDSWKCAARFAQDDLYMSANAVDGGPDVTTNLPDVTGLNFTIGARSDGNQLIDGYHKKLSFWDGELSDANIQGLADGTVSPGNLSYVSDGDDPYQRKRNRDSFRRHYRRR